MKSMTLESMLQDGFTRKFATYFLNILEEEKHNPIFDQGFVEWAHSRGFSAEFASVLELTEENYKDYLPEYDFYKVWPLNNWSRIWINDKLTLKYTLSKTEFAAYMPLYYYYSRPDGLRSLMDNPIMAGGENYSAFIDTLKQVGDFACKPCNGTQSSGFYKLSYSGGFFINDQEVSEAEIIEFVKQHPNYVFTEYLRPSKEWAIYSPLIHTLRIMIINEHGNDPRFFGNNNIRIPHTGGGAANYIRHDGTNNEEYNIYASLDLETGKYGNTLAVYPNGVKKISVHPDTGADLNGQIDCINELKKVSMDIALWLNNLEFIGLDFGITTSGVKIMEINTHPGMTVSQYGVPLYKDDEIKRYFEKKLAEIDSMSEEERIIRNNIPR